MDILTHPQPLQLCRTRRRSILEQHDVPANGDVSYPFLDFQNAVAPFFLRGTALVNSVNTRAPNNDYSRLALRSQIQNSGAAIKPSMGFSPGAVQSVAAFDSGERPSGDFSRLPFHTDDSSVCSPDPMHVVSPSVERPAIGHGDRSTERNKFRKVDRNGYVYFTEIANVANAPLSGPATCTWQLLPRGPRRQVLSPSQVQAKKDYNAQFVQQQQFGGIDRYNQPIAQLPRCMYCKLHKIKCEPNFNDPYGPCRACLSPKLLKSTLGEIPCLRDKISDASLFREQERPWAQWTNRWDSMEIRNIRNWSSMKSVRANISNCIKDASYELELRPFRWMPGDQTFQMWKNTLNREIYHEIPHYAIVDMHEAARSIRQYVDSKIAHHVAHFLKDSDVMFSSTFFAAFRWSQEAPTTLEGQLIVNCLCLWVVCRMASSPETICNTDTIGSTVMDPCSPYYGMRPLPPVLNAQLEIIMYSTLLRPLRHRVLDQLESLMKRKVQANWVTVYLALFILLHNCSMTTRRDAEFAYRSGLETTFANPESIVDHHKGILVMLLHFHLDGRGKYLTSLTNESVTVENLARSEGIPMDLAQLLKASAINIKHKRCHIDDVRASAKFGDDYYFVSQLFDHTWRPARIAALE